MLFQFLGLLLSNEVSFSQISILNKKKKTFSKNCFDISSIFSRSHLHQQTKIYQKETKLSASFFFSLFGFPSTNHISRSADSNLKISMVQRHFLCTEREGRKVIVKKLVAHMELGRHNQSGVCFTWSNKKR